MLDKNLKVLIEYSKTTKLYKELYKNLGDEYQLTDVPFLEPAYLREIGPEYFLNTDEALCVYFTSGTTSKPKAFYHSPKDITYAKDYIKWIQEIEGIAGGEKMAIFMDQSFWGIGYFTIVGSVHAGNAVIPIDSGLSKEVVADLIRISKPTVLSSLPSLLEEYKEVLRCPTIRVIETTGEPLVPEMRKELQEYFNADIYDAYGLTEGIIGVECSQHDGYHFDPQRNLLETLDLDTDEGLQDEQWGELILTVLNQSPLPIIRYRSGDVCKISHGKCPCGRNFPRVWVKGRKEQTILLYEGSYVPVKDLEKIIFDTCGKSVPYEFNIIRNPNFVILEIILDDCKQKDQIVSRIQNLNYETLYLSKRNKLRIVVKKPE